MKDNNKPKEKIWQEWVLKAQEDELSAEAILKENAPPSTVCFLSQQMAEKYLKGFLVFSNKNFPKIHQLDVLLEMCGKIDKSFLKLKKQAVYLSDYCVTGRYPGDYSENISKTEAEKAFNMAKTIKDFALKKIKT